MLLIVPCSEDKGFYDRQGMDATSSNYDDEIPDGVDVIELLESKYLMFQGEPFNEAILN